MKLNSETIYSFKLTNGEEIVCKVILHNLIDNVIEIAEPMSVVAGQNGIGLAPTMFTATSTKKPQLNIGNIMIWAETEEIVQKKYLEAITGLKLPDKQMILG